MHSGKFYAFSSSEDSDSDDVAEVQQTAVTKRPIVNVDSTDSEDNETRIVRTEKEKRTEELQTFIKRIRNNMAIRDTTTLLDNFENLLKTLERSKKMVESDGVPKFYIRILAEMESWINDCWEKHRKTLNRLNSSNLTKLRQKLKKYNKENFEKELAEFAEHPENFPDENAASAAAEEEGVTAGAASSGGAGPASGFFKDESEDSDDDDDDDVDHKKTAKTASNQRARPKSDLMSNDQFVSDDEIGAVKKAAKPATTGDDDDDSEWGDSSSDSSTSSESEDEDRKAYFKKNPWARFLKDPPPQFAKAKSSAADGGDDDKKRSARKLHKKKAAAAITTATLEDGAGADNDDAEWTKVDHSGRVERVVRAFEPGTTITYSVVKRRLEEIVASRGRSRSMSKLDQVELLRQIDQAVKDSRPYLGDGLRVKIGLCQVALMFDLQDKSMQCMKEDVWVECLQVVRGILELMRANMATMHVNEAVPDEEQSIEHAPYLIQGCILSTLERLDEEFTHILQNLDPHGNEYIERLRDEATLCTLIDDLCDYLEKVSKQHQQSRGGGGAEMDLCRAYLCRIEHLYYRYDPASTEKAITAAATETTSIIQRMDAMCRYIYVNDRLDRARTRAILCQMYFLAQHDHWFKARDLMSMSYLQQSIDKADVPTQVLFNRVMIQLGLCAFRRGLIRDAHQALAELQASGRAKELLAQGLLASSNARNLERSAEEEKRDRLRQIPFHMHINLELVECVYLVSAMLTDVPYCLAASAANAFASDGRRRYLSKNFHFVLKNSERQVLVGRPESMRDHVVAASKALYVGNWKQCVGHIINEKMNARVWNLLPHGGNSGGGVAGEGGEPKEEDAVRAMLTNKIKHEALRCFLLGHSQVFESVSLPRLANQFQLELSEVHQLVSRMVLNEELPASLDDPTHCLVMHRTEPSRLQGMAVRLADKLNQLGEFNERMAMSAGGGGGSMVDKMASLEIGNSGNRDRRH